MFPEPCLHFRILTLELSRQPGLFICLSHLKICQFLKARPRSDLSLRPSTYRAAGTKRPARLLLPAAGCPCQSCFGAIPLQAAPPPQEPLAPATEKGSGPAAAHNGPFDSTGRGSFRKNPSPATAPVTKASAPRVARQHTAGVHLEATAGS